MLTLILLLLTVCRHCLISDQTTSSRPFATQLVCSTGAHCHTNGHLTYCTSPHRHKNWQLPQIALQIACHVRSPWILSGTCWDLAKSTPKLTCIRVTGCYAVHVRTHVHVPVRAKPTRGVRLHITGCCQHDRGVFGRLSTAMLRTEQSHPTGRLFATGRARSSCFDFDGRRSPLPAATQSNTQPGL